VSPTYTVEPRFWREFDRLTRVQQLAFLAARDRFAAGLQDRPPRFDPALRVKRVRGTTDVWELSWAADGRALFRYGPERQLGEPHIVWLRVGTHAILT